MNCLDEGLLQALIDGELSADVRREAEAHVASCPSCAAAVAGAAQELALFSQAFTIDESPVVPTERLRANIASAVAEMQGAQAVDGVAARAPSGGRARSFWSSLAASLAPRQAAVFASLALAAVVLGAAFFALRPDTQTVKDELPGIAKGTRATTPITGASAADPVPTPAVAGSGSHGESGDQIAKGIGPKTVRPEPRKIRPKGGAGELVKFRPKGAELAEAEKLPRPPGGKSRGGAADLLPVERQYAMEIAALKSSIERQKLQTLSPTLRAEYERNVAVVDEAIASTRAAVKSNPEDRDAQEFLRAAYRDKLDLLSAVAGKSQLAAVAR